MDDYRIYYCTKCWHQDEPVQLPAGARAIECRNCGSYGTLWYVSYQTGWEDEDAQNAITFHRLFDQPLLSTR